MERKPHSSSDDVRRRSVVSANPTAEKAKSLLSLDVSMLSTLAVVAEKCTSTPDALHRFDGSIVEEKLEETKILESGQEEQPRTTELHVAHSDEEKTVSPMEQPTTVPVQKSTNATCQNTPTPLQIED